MDDMNPKSLTAFEGYDARRHYDDDSERWYFSVIDIVATLTEATDRNAAAIYWRTLKSRLRKEGSNAVEGCLSIKMIATDGRRRKTDVAPMKRPNKVGNYE